jgi:hypothetical protein
LRLQADQINVDTTSYFDGILQKSMLRPTSVEGHDGDLVALIISSCKAADVVIHHVNDARNCHGIPLGPNKVSMRITKFPMSSGTLELPFMHNGGDTIAEALGTVILWEIKTSNGLLMNKMRVLRLIQVQMVLLQVKEMLLIFHR